MTFAIARHPIPIAFGLVRKPTYIRFEYVPELKGQKSQDVSLAQVGF
jgi:hypothetical protein